MNNRTGIWHLNRHYDYLEGGSHRAVNPRCNICDATSSSEISLDESKVYTGTFYKDPHKSGYLCGRCYSPIADVLTDFDIQDELEGKLDWDPARGYPEKKKHKPLREMTKTEMRNLLVNMKVDASIPIAEARKNWNLDELAQREIEGRM